MVEQGVVEKGGSVQGGISSHHPEYQQRIDDWEMMADVLEGERAVKDGGNKYLPYTAGQKHRGGGTGNVHELGEEHYQAYKTRAVFPDITSDAREALLGILHRKPPNIKVPKEMKGFIDNLGVSGETAHLVLQNINAAQLGFGRCGVLLDLPKAGGDRPYVALYPDPRTIINWDDGAREDPVVQKLNLVVLDETEYVRTRFAWKRQQKYRVLKLGDLDENESHGIYSAELWNEKGPSDSVEVSLRGNKLNHIPFVFINSTNLLPTPSRPPLLGLASLALAIYRLEADHRQALFMQGQATLAATGVTPDEMSTVMVGALAVIGLLNPDARINFISPDGSTISEMRHQLENDKKLAALKGAQLIDTTSRQRESGEALKIRVAAQTATLHRIAIVGAFGLQAVLRDAAEWMGLDKEEVQVEPNLDFTSDSATADELVKLLTAKVMKAPLSFEEIHEWLKEHGFTTKTFEETMEKIEKEGDLIPSLTSEQEEEIEDDEDEEEEEVD